MTDVLQVAEKMATWGVLRYVDYAGADIAALIAEATAWLSPQIPRRTAD
jgi:hypothetical protein